jgi:hypothetical protein
VTPSPSSVPSSGRRIYLGWQYATVHPEPGPPPRRPTPPEQERLNPDWAVAQRREESRLNRPLRGAFAVALAAGLILVILGAAGVLGVLAAGLGLLCCVLAAALAGYAVWQRERALRARLAAERDRVARLRDAQQSRLFAWQQEHAAQMRAWQELRAAFEDQKRWYAVCAPDSVHRVDVAGGTLSGWSAMLATAAAQRLAAGGEVTVLDLSEGAVGLDLLAATRSSGLDPLVWVLPEDLPRLDLGTGLSREALADVLSLVVSVTGAGGTGDGAGGDREPSVRDLALDNVILERVIDVLDDGEVTVARVAAGLRVLAQAGDPRDDVAAGLISAGQMDRLTAMFGRGATDRVVLERAWVLESQLRKLAAIGTAPAVRPRSPLRVVALGRRVGVLGGRVLGTYLAVALTHALRETPPSRPWQHTVFLLGADRLRGDTLDRLCDACESSGTGLVLAYRTIPPHVRSRLGRGNAAVAFMRLGNAEDAKAASEQIGTEHRFVLSQLTETIGVSVTDTTSDAYTSTTSSTYSAADSWSSSEGTSRSAGQGRSESSLLLPAQPSYSRSVQTSDSLTTGQSQSVSTGVSTSTAWGRTTSRAAGDSESLATAMQRSREFLVEQHELQRLPASAMIITYAGPAGRQVVMADANPGIGGLSAATELTLEEFRARPALSQLAGSQPPSAQPVPAQPVPAQPVPAQPVPAQPPSAPFPSTPSPPTSAQSPSAPAGSAPAQENPQVPRPRPGPPADDQAPSGHFGSPAAPDAGSDTASEAGRGAVAEAAPDAVPGATPDAVPEAAPDAVPEAGPAAAPVSWRSGRDRPPPNLGPPPPRLDWRKPRR